LIPIPKSPKTPGEFAVTTSSRCLINPGVLQRETRGAYGQMTVDQHLSIVFYDTVVHTWDLAKAVAQPVTIDRKLADRALEAIAGLAEAEDVRVPGWLASVRAIGVERDSVDRLVAFSGRDPDWRRRDS
jgi:uncharacterized protein (TIGR03086 family)